MRHVSKRTKDGTVKPLTEPVLLILISLSDQPRHGYSLMKHIESVSDGRVQMSTGTLYGAVRRLLADGWIERFEQADTSRDKQAYRLTSIGRKRLRVELNRLRHLTQAAQNLKIRTI